MSDLVLLTVVGPDRPAVTATLTRLLADAGADVLDIGQAVIHDNLNLGLLLRFERADALRAEVQALLEPMALKAQFTDVTEQSYCDWVAREGKDRHIITLLTRAVSAAQLAALTQLLADQGLNIDAISRLSGRVPLGGAAPTSKACVEFSARGTPRSAQQLREGLLRLAARHEMDLAFQADDLFRRNRRLVCFDMDSTLIEAEVIDELAACAGAGAEVAAITERAMRGEIDFNVSFRERLRYLKGLPESVLEEVAARLPVTEGAGRLLATLRRLGYKTAIISGGFEYFGRFLQQKLGIDYVFANQLPIADGVVTGEAGGVIIDGARKAQLLRELAEREQIALEQVIAVGDGANDLPMLSIAGLGIAFRAKPLVKASAQQAISTLGLDAILYLMGLRDRELSATDLGDESELAPEDCSARVASAPIDNNTPS